MTKDLTKGDPIKVILQFSIPILFGLVLQQIYSLVDTMIVGKFLGVDALGGVGSTGAINFLVLGFCIGLCAGFGIPAANAFGAKDLSQLRRFVANSIYLCAGVAVVVMTIVLVFCKDFLTMMNTTPETYQYAYDYIYVIFWGIPCIMLYNMTAAIIRAVGDSKSPVIFLAIAAGINVVLDLLFILVFQMGVGGAAWATNLSQGISGLLCLLYMKKKLPILAFQPGDMAPNRRDLIQLTANGLPMGLQYFITAIGSVLLQSAVNGLGTAYVNAVAVSGRLCGLLCCPSDAVSTTMATYCGQNAGARKPDRIRKGIHVIWLITIFGSILFFAVSWLFTPALSLLFLDASEVEVIALVHQYMIYTGAFSWAIFILNGFRFSVQGMGYSNLAIFSGVMELIARTLMALYLIPHFGYIAVCLSSPLAWFMADCFLTPTVYWCLRRLEQRMEVANPANL